MTGFLSFGIGPGTDIARFITLGLDIGEPWLGRPRPVDAWVDEQVAADPWSEELTAVTDWTDV